jgi:hypothetical protein
MHKSISSHLPQAQGQKLGEQTRETLATMKRCAKSLTQVCFVILRNFSDKALKWQFSYTGLRVFLVLPDLSQRHCSRPVPVGFFCFQSFSVERRFQKLDLDPQQLVFDYLPADAVGLANLSHRLSAAEKLVDLLELLTKAVVCLPSLAFSVLC